MNGATLPIQTESHSRPIILKGVAALHVEMGTPGRDERSSFALRSVEPLSRFLGAVTPDKAIGWEANFVRGKQSATTPDYARKYGLPAANTVKPDWIVGGRIRNGEFTTRSAPAKS